MFYFPLSGTWVSLVIDTRRGRDDLKSAHTETYPFHPRSWGKKEGMAGSGRPSSGTRNGAMLEGA